MKILYLNGGATPIKDKAIDKIRALGHELIFYDPMLDLNEKFKWETRHFQIYQKVLNIAEDIKADILYFSTSVMPEYLLFELKTRPNYKPKIIFHLMLRGLNRSMARCLALKELIDMPQIIRVVANTMIVEGIRFPENMIKVGTNFNKIKLISESFNEESEDLSIFETSQIEARKYFLIEPKEFVILLSGTWAYIKGVDIFIEALKYIEEDIRVIIHRHKFGEDKTLDPDLLQKAYKYHKKIFIYDKWFNSKEYPLLFKAADVIVCAHRKSYEYSESGIPGLAAKAKRLVVVPDFYFFNEIISRYKFGEVYQPEDPISMANTINLVKNSYAKIWSGANFNGVTLDYKEISDIPLMALENL
jgi:glycosyltransferase involved in cell wall biosynthesis